jgi:hypothetical protein
MTATRADPPIELPAAGPEHRRPILLIIGDCGRHCGRRASCSLGEGDRPPCVSIHFSGRGNALCCDSWQPPIEMGGAA